MHEVQIEQLTSAQTPKSLPYNCFLISRAHILNFIDKGVFILGRPYGEGRLVDDRESAFMQEARLSMSSGKTTRRACGIRTADA